MSQIGFIGLGHMGTPMVQNLLKAGHAVKIYDVVPDAVLALAKEGAIPQKSVKETAQDVDIIFTMVQTGAQVKDICLGPDGIFSTLKKETLYIDSSSIEIKTTLELHKEAMEAGIGMLDAPVSGGVLGAKEGTLTIMVGGDEAHFLKVKPILGSLGKKIILAGQNGCGQAAKICNNLILAISMIGVSEGFSLAEKLGLDPKVFFDISSNASGQCWSMTKYCPVPGIIEAVPANRDYAPGFMAKMMLKDLHLAQHAAEDTDAMIPMGAVAAELYSLFIHQYNGEMDFSGIYKMIAGIE